MININWVLIKNRKTEITSFTVTIIIDKNQDSRFLLIIIVIVYTVNSVFYSKCTITNTNGQLHPILCDYIHYIHI